MSGLRVRFRLRAPGLSWCLPGERVLFSKDKLWYYRYKYSPWQSGEGMYVPFLVNLYLYVTNRRAVTIIYHPGTLSFEISQWRKNAAEPGATEFITGVHIGQRHFGSVKFDFCGLGRGRFGLGRTYLPKGGGDVPYLEITSTCPGRTRPRIVQVFMGIDGEAKNSIQSAYAALADRPAEG